MKKLFIIGLMLISTSVIAQKTDASKVPAAVKKTFTGKAAGATDVNGRKRMAIMKLITS